MACSEKKLHRLGLMHFPEYITQLLLSFLRQRLLKFLVTISQNIIKKVLALAKAAFAAMN
jgi:uncharacterized membrane protein YheB (UPF0754 family)